MSPTHASPAQARNGTHAHTNGNGAHSAPPLPAAETWPFLKSERATLERFFPGFDAELRGTPLMEMETPESPTLAWFKQRRGPALLVPEALGGLGASLHEAVQLQRAIGSRCPSLAIATTMHHFSVSSLVDMARLRPGGLETMLLSQIAAQSLYLASAFAEGRTGTSIFSSGLRVERCLDGLRVNGSKKPCTLSHSFDLLTASLLVPGQDGAPDRFAVAVIPAGTPGIERRPFWASPILAGTQSDEVALRDVIVPEMQVAYLGEPQELDAIQLGGFLAFELLVTASYLGIASGLIERALREQRGAPADRVAIASELEAAAAALEGVARAADASRAEERALVARSLFVRLAVQAAIERATDLALGILGGMSFVGSPEVSYLLSASRALAFHPPSRRTCLEGLDAYLRGEPLVLA